jgi:hypothetical protein
MKKKHWLRFFTSFLLVLFVHFSLAQANTSNILSGSQGPVFTENKGQILSLEEKKSLDNILFKVSSSKGDLYVTTNGISYVFSVLKGGQEKKSDSSFRNRRKPVLQAPQINREKLHYEIERVDINLENAKILKSHAEIFYKTDIVRYNYLRKNNMVENIRMIEKVIIHDVYPGIDWVLYINSSGGHAMLKQDFILHPGADTRNIVFQYSGNAKLDVDEVGNLIVKSRMGQISESRPLM